MGRLAGGNPTMGQSQIDVELHDDGREHGFAICQDPEGNFTKGRETIGHRYGVQIDVSCPTGYQCSGLFHTHPGGTPKPSRQDIKEACRLGIRHLCIAVPDTGELVCHDIADKCR